MASSQWDSMGQVANIAQLTGMDGLGLISMIVQSAQAVRRNKETCQELAQDVQLMCNLLRMLRDPEMMCQEEIMNALSGLEGTLMEAYALVTSCRDCSAMYRFFMGWKQADQFRRVKKKIAKYLQFYPMISHADLTRRLEKLATGAALSVSLSQDAQEALASSSTSHTNPEARAEEVTNEFEIGQRLTQSINDEEHHQSGQPKRVLTSSASKSKSWWHEMISSKKAAAAAKAHILSSSVELFTLADLEMATMNFSLSREVSNDIHGSVYMGLLPGGREVAINRKRLYSYNQGMENFLAEVTILSLLHHRHIISLIGCCVVEIGKRRLLFGRKNKLEERLLVFEHMKNGSLFTHLHGPSTSSFSSPVTISWKTRIEILLGVSQAINYMHSCVMPPVIHCNITSSNIMLDSCWAPRLSGFHSARRYDEAAESIDPEYVYRDTPASDLYSFGIVMLEVLSGRKPCDWDELYLEDEHGDNEPMDFPSAALLFMNAGELWKILDKRPGTEPTLRQLEAADLVARTAVHCLQEKGEDIPAMSDVMARLQAALELISCDDE
uniref:Protein kinase domain-containing protein n=1 Tax=Leersia perrieri TaxID=77586 RepID=A0A0D9XV38_9ORYZ